MTDLSIGQQFLTVTFAVVAISGGAALLLNRRQGRRLENTPDTYRNLGGNDSADNDGSSADVPAPSPGDSGGDGGNSSDG